MWVYHWVGIVSYLFSVVRSGSILGDDGFLTDLVIMPMDRFDIILGMDWLYKYRVIIDDAQ